VQVWHHLDNASAERRRDVEFRNLSSNARLPFLQRRTLLRQHDRHARLDTFQSLLKGSDHLDRLADGVHRRTDRRDLRADHLTAQFIDGELDPRPQAEGVDQ
jgi:hypothetical protein